MARQVFTLSDIRQLQEPGRTGNEPAGTRIAATTDSYTDRLLKYIPAEVVTLYMLVLGLTGKFSAAGDMKVIQWVIFVIFCLLTYGYLRRVAKVHKVQQLLISILAFIVWVFALGGPFALYSWYNPVYGEILLPVYTFTIAIWEAEK